MMYTKKLSDAFNTLTTEVLVNDVPQQAVISSAHLGMQSKRHMHSLQPFKQGDYVVFNKDTYMVVEDVINPRGIKYKATIQHCNKQITLAGETIKIQDGFDDRGRPHYIYVTQPGRVVDVVAFMDRVSLSGSQIRVNNSVVSIFAPDTVENREKILVNDVFPIDDTYYKITSINHFRVGLMDIALELTTTPLT